MELGWALLAAGFVLQLFVAVYIGAILVGVVRSKARRLATTAHYRERRLVESEIVWGDGATAGSRRCATHAGKVGLVI